MRERKVPPGPPPPLLWRWECGCIGLQPGEGDWGLVVEACDESGHGPAEWRWCRYGAERMVAEESAAEWARLKREGDEARRRVKAASALLEALSDLEERNG
jgi:hypothetical protein